MSPFVQCNGFKPSNYLTSYPFNRHQVQYLPWKFNELGLHDKSCTGTTTEPSGTNPLCSLIQFTSMWSNLKRQEAEFKPQSHTPNKFLSWNNLLHRSEHYRQVTRYTRLKYLNAVRDARRRTAAISELQKLQHAIAHSSVPRVHRILAVGLNNHRSSTYLLGQVRWSLLKSIYIYIYL